MSTRAQIRARAFACVAAMIVATGALAGACDAANPYRSSEETGYPSDLVNIPNCSTSETSVDWQH